MSLADIGALITNQGEVLFANADIAGDGQPIIRTDFPGLDSSPWFYDALTDYFQRVAIRKLKPGTVAKWTGTYMLFKNGNSRFSGKVAVLDI